MAILVPLITWFGVGWIVFGVGTVVKGSEESLLVLFVGGLPGSLTVCAGVWFVSTSSRWDD